MPTARPRSSDAHDEQAALRRAGAEGGHGRRELPGAGTPACRRPRRLRWSSPCCASAEPACQTPAESTGPQVRPRSRGPPLLPRPAAPRPPTPRSKRAKGSAAPFLIKRIGKPRETFLESKVEVRGHCLLGWLRRIPVRGTPTSVLRSRKWRRTTVQRWPPRAWRTRGVHLV